MSSSILQQNEQPEQFTESGQDDSFVSRSESESGSGSVIPLFHSSYTYNTDTILVQEQQHRTPENQPIQPIQPRQFNETVNRYTTTVSIEVYQNGILRYIKWFSDLQMAYIWCMNQLVLYPDQEWDYDSDFLEFATFMDRRYRAMGLNGGYTVAESTRYKYRAYYEPNVDRNLIQNVS